MDFYVIRSVASQRFGIWLLKRTVDGEVMSSHDTYEDALAERDRLTREGGHTPLVVIPNPKRRAAINDAR